MDANKIDLYLMTNAKNFPTEKVMFLKEKLASLDDEKWARLSMVELKDPNVMLLISIFLGTFGIDRFMLGETGMGILKLLTGGLCGILTLIDWFTINKKTKEANFNNIMLVL